MIGTRYYLSIDIMKDGLHSENDVELTLNYLLLILAGSVTAVLSVSSLNER
jgi:ammonia channel protein AmtB